MRPAAKQESSDKKRTKNRSGGRSSKSKTKKRSGQIGKKISSKKKREDTKSLLERTANDSTINGAHSDDEKNGNVTEKESYIRVTLVKDKFYLIVAAVTQVSRVSKRIRKVRRPFTPSEGEPERDSVKHASTSKQMRNGHQNKEKGQEPQAEEAQDALEVLTTDGQGILKKTMSKIWNIPNGIGGSNYRPISHNSETPMKAPTSGGLNAAVDKANDGRGMCILS